MMKNKDVVWIWNVYFNRENLNTWTAHKIFLGLYVLMCFFMYLML